jgi:anti-anti-sigma factor
VTLIKTPPLPTRGPPPRLHQESRTVVRPRGEYDTSTVVALSGQLARPIARNDVDLVVDLHHVRFMDASTVGVIIEAREFLRPYGRSLTLRALSGIAPRVIELCDHQELVEHRAPSSPVLYPEP